MGEKVGELAQKINNLTNGEFTKFLLHHNLCPECGGSLLQRDDERACSSCGMVVEDSHFSQKLPFGSNNKITKSIEFENGLGGTLGLKGTRAVAWRLREKKPFKCRNPKCGYEGNYVCPKCGYETDDYPIRANQLVASASNFEHPKIRTLKNLGSLRAKMFGLDERRGTKASIFMNAYADRASKVAANYIVQNERISIPRLADVAFALTARDLLGMQKFKEVKKRLDLPDSYLEHFGIIYRAQARKVNK